jgi:hypothetical protein
MSSDVLRRLTEKKGKQLSKFLGIDSVPSTQLIANMQSRINNPLFELSMTDYEAMCGNKTKRNSSKNSVNISMSSQRILSRLQNLSRTK